MYYAGNFDITIGSYTLALMNSVEIVKSVEQLADTATIILPGAAYNQALDVENRIARGDKVVIRLGYNGALATEFEGWLQNISTDDNSIRLQCEDDIYLTRVSIPDKVLTDVSVKGIAQYVAEQLEMQVDCTYDFKYNKFTIYKATGFDVLKLIQEEVDANVFIKNGVIHIHPPYQDITGSVNYDFSVNIEKSDLEYKRAADRKYQVDVEGIMADGTRVSVAVGTAGGDKRSLKIRGVYDKEMLRKRGEEWLAKRIYDGYEGSIDGWLIPFAEPGYSASIRDVDYTYKNGTYYVVGVTTKVSAESGAVRTIELGAKLS